MEYTIEKLIEICEKAIVPQSEWSNRDSHSAQVGVGTCLALLKSGCKFEIENKTDEETIWIQFYVKSFAWFEACFEDDEFPNGVKDCNSRFYLPTEKRLNEANGKDWY